MSLVPSAAPRCLDRADVDLFHIRHRFECAFCFIAASRATRSTRTSISIPLLARRFTGRLILGVGHPPGVSE